MKIDQYQAFNFVRLSVLQHFNMSLPRIIMPFQNHEFHRFIISNRTNRPVIRTAVCKCAVIILGLKWRQILSFHLPQLRSSVSDVSMSCWRYAPYLLNQCLEWNPCPSTWSGQLCIHSDCKMLCLFTLWILHAKLNNQNEDNDRQHKTSLKPSRYINCRIYQAKETIIRAEISLLMIPFSNCAIFCCCNPSVIWMAWCARNEKSRMELCCFLVANFMFGYFKPTIRSVSFTARY